MAWACHIVLFYTFIRLQIWWQAPNEQWLRFLSQTKIRLPTNMCTSVDMMWSWEIQRETYCCTNFSSPQPLDLIPGFLPWTSASYYIPGEMLMAWFCKCSISLQRKVGSSLVSMTLQPAQSWRQHCLRPPCQAGREIKKTGPVSGCVWNIKEPRFRDNLQLKPRGDYPC